MEIRRRSGKVLNKLSLLSPHCYAAQCWDVVFLRIYTYPWQPIFMLYLDLSWTGFSCLLFFTRHTFDQCFSAPGPSDVHNEKQMQRNFAVIEPLPSSSKKYMQHKGRSRTSLKMNQKKSHPSDKKAFVIPFLWNRFGFFNSLSLLGKVNTAQMEKQLLEMP